MRGAGVRDAHLYGTASGEPPRPDRGAAERTVLALALDMAHHDHRARDDAEVVGVDLEPVPDGLDVLEVLPQAVVADVGSAAPGGARGRLDVELAGGVDEVQRALEVAYRERGVDRPDDVDVLREPCRVAVVLRSRHLPQTDRCHGARDQPPRGNRLPSGTVRDQRYSVAVRADGRGAASGRTGI